MQVEKHHRIRVQQSSVKRNRANEMEQKITWDEGRRVYNLTH